MVALSSLAMHFKSKTRTLENWLEHAKSLESVHIQLFCIEKLHDICASGHEEHRRFKRGADLKQNVVHFVLEHFSVEHFSEEK